MDAPQTVVGCYIHSEMVVLILVLLLLENIIYLFPQHNVVIYAEVCALNNIKMYYLTMNHIKKPQYTLLPFKTHHNKF